METNLWDLLFYIIILQRHMFLQTLQHCEVKTSTMETSSKCLKLILPYQTMYQKSDLMILIERRRLWRNINQATKPILFHKPVYPILPGARTFTSIELSVQRNSFISWISRLIVTAFLVGEVFFIHLLPRLRRGRCNSSRTHKTQPSPVSSVQKRRRWRLYRKENAMNRTTNEARSQEGKSERGCVR